MADAGMTLDCFVYIMQEMMLNDGHASFNYVGLPRLVEITSQDSSQGCQGCSGCPRIPENPPRESSPRILPEDGPAIPQDRFKVKLIESNGR